MQLNLHRGTDRVIQGGALCASILRTVFCVEVVLKKKHKSFHSSCLQSTVANIFKIFKYLQYFGLVPYPLISRVETVSAHNSNEFLFLCNLLCPDRFQMVLLMFRLHRFGCMPSACISPPVFIAAFLFFLIFFFNSGSYLRNVWQGRKIINKTMTSHQPANASSNYFP